MKLKIKVTKEILQRSMMCGETLEQIDVHTNCAIALACQEIFPKSIVSKLNIYDSEFIMGIKESERWRIKLPSEATNFILDFDTRGPEERLNMPELEFEVELNDDVLACINIDELKPILEESKTLELITN